MGKADVQATLLNALRKDHIPAKFFLVNGFQMDGIVESFDQFVVVITNQGRQNMLYKHAISTIAPSKNINLRAEES